MVVESHASVPSDSGASVGMVYAAASSRSTGVVVVLTSAAAVAAYLPGTNSCSFRFSDSEITPPASGSPFTIASAIAFA